MFKVIHKIKPFINSFLKVTGLYIVFHKLVITLFSKREKLSKKYIHGSGLEIGALHTPLKVFGAKVTYVDHLSTSNLRKHYPELKNFPFVPVGIVDNGEVLKKVKSNSQDFIIANHFVEHCENPIAMLRNQLRVLRSGGILFWAIPDKRYTFDANRPLTSIQHVEKDYREGPQVSRLKHYEEWVSLIGSERGGKTKKTARALMKEHYSIHFHTFTKESFEKFIKQITKKHKLPLIRKEITPNINEFIVVLRKK